MPKHVVEVLSPSTVAQMMSDGKLDERTAIIEKMIADGTQPQYTGN